MNGVYPDSLNPMGYSLYFQVDGSGLTVDAVWSHSATITDCNGDSIDFIANTWWAILADSVYTCNLHLTNQSYTNTCYPLTVEFYVWDPIVDTCRFTINAPALSTYKIADNIFIYPNPAKDKIFISDNELLKGAECSVYDLYGRILKVEKISADYINLDNLTSGIYFLKIGEVPDRIFKIIKQR